MSGVRIADDIRLCHARAGIVTGEGRMAMVLTPEAAAIGRISGAAGQCSDPGGLSERPAQMHAVATLRLAAAANRPL